ncbi:MAG: hypothetical protein ACI8X5_001461, partial [Planctomycetota bacterium]
ARDTASRDTASVTFLHVRNLNDERRVHCQECGGK